MKTCEQRGFHRLGPVRRYTKADGSVWKYQACKDCPKVYQQPVVDSGTTSPAPELPPQDTDD